MKFDQDRPGGKKQQQKKTKKKHLYTSVKIEVDDGILGVKVL